MLADIQDGIGDLLASDGNGEAEMPLQFIVDQDLPADIKTITLSYTLFDVTSLIGDKVASR